MPDSAAQPTSRKLIKARVAATSVADLVVDLLLPTLVYLALAPAGLSTSVRLTVGGFFVAAKATAGHIGEPAEGQSAPAAASACRRAVAGFALAAAAALVCTVTTIAVAKSGAGNGWSIGAGTAVLSVVTAVTTLRAQRRVDGFALLVLVEVAATIILTSISSDPRFVLARPSFYTAIAGIWALTTVRARRPFMMQVSKPMAVAGDPVRAAAFERAGMQSPRFRRAEQAMTAGLGVVLIAEAVLRVVTVYSRPAADVVSSSLLSQLPAIALIVVYFAAIRIFAIPVARREVDALMPRTDERPIPPPTDNGDPCPDSSKASSSPSC